MTSSKVKVKKRHQGPSKGDKIDLGQVVLFDNAIRVYYDPKFGRGAMGQFGFSTPNNGFIVITVGEAGLGWSETMTALTHELWEVSLRLAHAAYEPTASALQNYDTARFMFSMTHVTFQEVCQQATYAAEYIRPYLKKAWELNNGHRRG